MFIADASAVSLDAKQPAAKTRALEENTESLLQEAIGLELIGLKLTCHGNSTTLELPADLLLDNDTLSN